MIYKINISLDRVSLDMLGEKEGVYVKKKEI